MSDAELEKLLDHLEAAANSLEQDRPLSEEEARAMNFLMESLGPRADLTEEQSSSDGPRADLADEQSPSEAQLETIEGFLKALRRVYRVPSQRVHTHQEWPDAATACPGGRLQEWARGARRAGRF